MENQIGKPLSNNVLIENWMVSRERTKRSISEEREMRELVVLNTVGSTTDKYGTEKFQFPEIDTELTVTMAQTISVDVSNQELTQIVNTMIGTNDTFDANALVSWKPVISMSSYRRLSPELQAILNPAITIKDSAVQLKTGPLKGDFK